jgi:hypothetical protein
MTFIVLGNKYNSGVYKQGKILYSLVKDAPIGESLEDEE